MLGLGFLAENIINGNIFSVNCPQIIPFGVLQEPHSWVLRLFKCIWTPLCYFFLSHLYICHIINNFGGGQHRGSDQFFSQQKVCPPPNILNLGPPIFKTFLRICTMITTYNAAVTDAAREILGKECRRKKPWVTRDVLDLCDERRNLKKKRYEAEGAKEYREANRRIQKAVKKAKDWIGTQWEEIETWKKNQRQESIPAWWMI